MDPLVVTLRCEGPGWLYCQQLRILHFPPERNIVPAHIALFHQLPGEALEQICKDARNVAPHPFAVQITRLRSLGRGVAMVLESATLLALHRSLSQVWQQWLSPQDLQKFSPHITIQNKAEPAQARQLLQHLNQTFMPFRVDAIGLDFWHYRNGPWEAAASVEFSQ